MTEFLWVGPVLLTLYLAGWSLYQRKWWVVPYLLTGAVGFGAGLLLWTWPELPRVCWWFLWLGYLMTLPIVKAWLLRRRARGDDYVA